MRLRPPQQDDRCKDALEHHIAGVTLRPIYSVFASTEPSGCLSQPKMMIGVPALISSFLAGAAAAMTVCGVTIIFFSPSLYFTVSVSPSFSFTMLVTYAL